MAVTTTTSTKVRRLAAVLVASAGFAASDAAAQSPATDRSTVTVIPGPEYSAGALRRSLLGSRYRELWLTPIEVPVLDLATFAGGLTPEDRGGTSQSIVLHMRGADGREWHFRSVDKDVSQGLPDALAGTFSGRVIQDQTSALHPGAAFVVEPLMEAAGLLHETPRAYVMPDDPRLGEFREEFAGMLGIVVERPNEGENGEILYGGSEKIVGMDEMLERLEESGDHLIDAEEYLTARLLDMLVGDTDRGLDQWRWARYGEEGSYTWRPIARDRDWAFVVADGLLPTLARGAYPKLGKYDEEYGALSQYVFMSASLDRRLLASLDRTAFDSIGRSLADAITDAVIDAGIDAMPTPFVSLDGPWLARALRARRDSLPRIAAEFYEFLAREVDVEVSDEAEEAVIDRAEDGSVTMTVRRVGPGEDSTRTVVERQTFRRRFLPDETAEIRLDLHGGDDHAVVRGSGAGIRVRVMGGGDDDVLTDSSDTRAARSDTYLYDSSGDNEFVGGDGTHLDERDFDPPEAAGPWPATKISGYKDWGSSSGLAPVLRYRSGAGTVLGLSRTWTKYGFRRVPYKRRFEVAGLLATGVWRPGVEASARFRGENSPFGLALGGRAIGFHTLRFFGYGNDSPDAADSDSRVIRQNEYRAAVHAEARLPAGVSVALGPFVRYTEVTDFDVGGPFDALGPEDGAAGYGAAGLEAEAELEWRSGRPLPPPEAAAPEGPAEPEAGELEMAVSTGDEDHDSHELEGPGEEPDPSFRVEGWLGGSWVPETWDVVSAFGEAHAIANTRIKIPGLFGPEVGVRVGGQRVWGDFPFHEAAYVGGRRTLRGFHAFRYAGDTAAFANLEVGVPLFDLDLLVRGRLGVFGLVDTGRVWLDGASPDGWHTGAGGGVFFRALGRVVRVMVATGEDTLFYFDFGLK